MHDERSNGGESQRSDGAHRGSRQGSVDLSMACDVAGVLGVNRTGPFESAPELVRAAMKQLDVLVFEAISGKYQALEEIRILWPSMQIELDAGFVTELREEYLKYALTIWNRYLAHDLPDPLRAVDALEVMCLLFDE